MDIQNEHRVFEVSPVGQVSADSQIVVLSRIAIRVRQNILVRHVVHVLDYSVTVCAEVGSSKRVLVGIHPLFNPLHHRLDKNLNHRLGTVETDTPAGGDGNLVSLIADVTECLDSRLLTPCSKPRDDT